MKNFKNLSIIKKFDRSDMLGLILGLPDQCRKAIELGKAIKPDKKFSRIHRIVISGMGGSAISGDILRGYLADKIDLPVFVNRNYSVPDFVDSSTLFFAASYSGNTEETVSAFKKARSKGAKIIGITSGGKISALCGQYGYPVCRLPGGQPPRSAIGYLFFPLLLSLMNLGVVRGIEREIDQTVSFLMKKVKEYDPCLSGKNIAYKLTHRIFGRIPLIYGSDEATGICAFRWKTQFNENSKVLAFSSVFPELDHNEIMGWEDDMRITKKFVVLVLRDRKDSQRMKKRIGITLDVIGKKPDAVYEVCAEGQFLLTRIFSLIVLGDFLSFYLAIARGIDPTVIKGINILKERLAH